jgi:hypothetical protein
MVNVIQFSYGMLQRGRRSKLNAPTTLSLSVNFAGHVLIIMFIILFTHTADSFVTLKAKAVFNL